MSETEYQTMRAALSFSPEWKAWEKQAYEQGWDWDESNDTGWMSDGHFAAFMDFVRTTKRIEVTEVDTVTRIVPAHKDEEASGQAE